MLQAHHKRVDHHIIKFSIGMTHSGNASSPPYIYFSINDDRDKTANKFGRHRMDEWIDAFNERFGI